MRSLVILALVGCACASSFLQYTPEVVAERARFQQLYDQAAALAAAAPDPVNSATHYHQAPATSHHYQHQAPATYNTQWRGPVAATVPAGLPGSHAQVQDTSDVAAARDAFLATYRAQLTATSGHKTASPKYSHAPTRSYNPQPTFNSVSQKWTGPLATNIPAGVDGKVTPVGDTADVAAARSAFFATYNKALAASQPAQKAPVYHAQPSVYHAQPTSYQSNSIHAPVQKWTGPVAATVPAGLPGSVSQVGPTAEVAAATNAFYQAYGNAVAATTGRRF